MPPWPRFGYSLVTNACSAGRCPRSISKGRTRIARPAMHHTIGAIRAATWEAINQALLASAKKDRLERGDS